MHENLIHNVKNLASITIKLPCKTHKILDAIKFPSAKKKKGALISFATEEVNVKLSGVNEETLQSIECY